MDGKDGRGLKIEEVGPTFSSFTPLWNSQNREHQKYL